MEEATEDVRVKIELVCDLCETHKCNCSHYENANPGCAYHRYALSCEKWPAFKFKPPDWYLLVEGLCS